MLELGIASEREFNRRVTQYEFLRWVAFHEEKNRRQDAAMTKARADAETGAKQARFMGRRA